MSKLIYVKELYEDSIIHFSWSGTSWKLRNYVYNVEPFLTNYDSDLTVEQIQRKAHSRPNMWFKDTPTVSYRKFEFWRDEIAKRNRLNKIGPSKISSPEGFPLSDILSSIDKEVLSIFSIQEIELIQMYRQLSVNDQATVIRMLQGLT